MIVFFLIYTILCLLLYMLSFYKMLRILDNHGFPRHDFFPLFYYMDFSRLIRNERNIALRKNYQRMLFWQGRLWIFLLVGNFLLLSTYFILRKYDIL